MWGWWYLIGTGTPSSISQFCNRLAFEHGCACVQVPGALGNDFADVVLTVDPGGWTQCYRVGAWQRPHMTWHWAMWPNWAVTQCSAGAPFRFGGCQVQWRGRFPNQLCILDLGILIYTKWTFRVIKCSLLRQPHLLTCLWRGSSLLPLPVMKRFAGSSRPRPMGCTVVTWPLRRSEGRACSWASGEGRHWGGGRHRVAPPSVKRSLALRVHAQGAPPLTTHITALWRLPGHLPYSAFR